MKPDTAAAAASWTTTPLPETRSEEERRAAFLVRSWFVSGANPGWAFLFEPTSVEAYYYSVRLEFERVRLLAEQVSVVIRRCDDATRGSDCPTPPLPQTAAV